MHILILYSKKLHLLKLEDIFKINILKFIYKYENGLLPNYFSILFIENTANHDHNTRNRNVNRIPIPRTTSAKETIRYYLPSFMNDIPVLVRDKISTHSLKGFTNYSRSHYINTYTIECNIQNCYICNQ